MLIINKLTKYYGADLILKDISFSIGKRDSLAIIGNNGAGKTTLLKAISNSIDYEGTIELAGGFKKVGWLKQEIDDNFLDYTIFDYIELGRGTKKISIALTECYEKLVQDSLSPDEQKLIYEKIEQLERTFTSLNGYEAEALIFSLAKGLNLPQQIKTIKLRELSGGQKAKVAFAQLLYAEPDVLLLDEPTNHLDPSAKDWIIDYISSYKGAVISISHDEEYLTKIPNKILMINDKTRTSEFFTNNYSEFLDIVKLRDEYLLKTFRNQLKKIEKVENFIQRLEGTSGKKKKQAKSREKMLIKMKSDLVDVPQKSKDALISFDLENELAKSPLTISNLSFSYTSEHPILKNIDLSLLPEERFIIIGKNGAGKTTLLKLIAGILKPQKGNINITNKTIIGYYAQEHENISNMGTVLDEAKNISYTEKETRKLLGRFKFSGDKVFQSVSTLSPGERSRLALLKLCMRRPNLMLLDEPTNHLDISTKRILAGALKKYKGTILMVSHDLEFLKEFGINRMLLLPQGKVLDYNENIIKKYRQLELIGEADE